MDTNEQKDFYSKQYQTKSQPRKYNDLLYGIKEYYLKILMPVKNKTMLCLVSGDGSKCRFFAKNGAFVVATDIVLPPLKRMKQKAQDECEDDSSISFVVADGHNLPFKQERFEVVYAMGVLHHLENSRASSEIFRVMRSNGLGLFKEPFGGNPLVWLYRMATPKIRTKSEHPFIYKDIKAYRRLFPDIRIKGFALVTLLAVPFLKMPKFSKRLLPFLRKIDELLFEVFPFLKYLAWAGVIVFSKSLPLHKIGFQPKPHPNKMVVQATKP